MTRVYFIKPIGMDGPIKVGCSGLPVKRREALQSWCPFPLEILAEVIGDNQIERRFHAKYWDSHRGHEWFDPTPEITSDIDAINDETFSVAGLPEPRQLPRKPRDMSYATPAWRYQRSVLLRVNKVGAPKSQNLRERIAKIGGGFGNDWLPHKKEIEELLASAA